MDERRYEELEAEAANLGREAGLAAASWFFDGDTDEETYSRVLAGMDEGDPEVMDTLPSGWLSGEYAGDPTPQTLADDLGVDISDMEEADAFDGLCAAYERAADDASYEEIERRARLHVDSANERAVQYQKAGEHLGR